MIPLPPPPHAARSLAAPDADSHDLQLNSGVMTCNGAWHDTHWTNTLGFPIYLTNIRWWIGASRGLLADILGVLWITRDQQSELVQVEQWDKYPLLTENPQIPPNDLLPGGVTVPPGAVLTLQQVGIPLVTYRVPLDMIDQTPMTPQLVMALHLRYVTTRPA